jgi:hypothetical protein
MGVLKSTTSAPWLSVRRMRSSARCNLRPLEKKVAFIFFTRSRKYKNRKFHILAELCLYAEWFSMQLLGGIGKILQKYRL